MSQKTPVLTLTVTAAGPVAACRFVGFGGAQVTAAGAKALGVSTTSALDGDDLAVDVIGTTVIESGGAIDLGDDIVSDAQGRAIVATVPGGGEVSTEAVLAQALDGASGAGEFVEVLLTRR